MAYESPVLRTESFLHGPVVSDPLASGVAAEIQLLRAVLDLRSRLRRDYKPFPIGKLLRILASAKSQRLPLFDRT